MVLRMPFPRSDPPARMTATSGAGPCAKCERAAQGMQLTRPVQSAASQLIRSVLRAKERGREDDDVGMSDQREIIGLWASASGPVLWVRPSRGRSVLVSLASGRSEPAIELGLGGRNQRTVVGRWDIYDGELRVPLPRLPYGAELILDYDSYTWTAKGGKPEEQLTGGVSRDDVPGARRSALPRWLLPRTLPPRARSNVVRLRHGLVGTAEVQVGDPRTKEKGRAAQRDAPDEVRDQQRTARPSQVISVLGGPRRERRRHRGPEASCGPHGFGRAGVARETQHDSCAG